MFLACHRLDLSRVVALSSSQGIEPAAAHANERPLSFHVMSPLTVCRQVNRIVEIGRDGVQYYVIIVQCVFCMISLR